MIAEPIVCVVLTGMPKREVTASVAAAAVSAPPLADGRA